MGYHSLHLFSPQDPVWAHVLMAVWGVVGAATLEGGIRAQPGHTCVHALRQGRPQPGGGLQL